MLPNYGFNQLLTDSEALAAFELSRLFKALFTEARNQARRARRMDNQPPIDWEAAATAAMLRNTLLLRLDPISLQAYVPRARVLDHILVQQHHQAACKENVTVRL